MKSILFDVDGVFLSEARCFDVSALTVYELLMSEDYLGLDPTVKFESLSDEEIQAIRSRVFKDDQILNRLKSLGLNSNWDMVFIITALHLVRILQPLPHSQWQDLLTEEKITPEMLQSVGEVASSSHIDFEMPLRFLQHVSAGKINVYQNLIHYTSEQLNVDMSSLFELKGPLWQLAQSIYQEWYLGYELFAEVEHQTPRTTFKQGYIYHETVLKPVDELKQLLEDLSGAHYQLAVVTGRPRTETIVPFETLGLKRFFDDAHIVTASEVLNAEAKYPELKPLGKPNPFSYLATLDGNQIDQYYHYATDQSNRVNKDEVFIVGDSLADLLSAKTIGATFIGPLTGLKGADAKEELEAHGADYIVNDVCDIRDILL